MTMNDKGLIRAMKEAYKGSGYEVAVTDGSVLIQTGAWTSRRTLFPTA